MFSLVIQVTPDENGDIELNPKTAGFPTDGLPDVVSITLTTNETSDISDVYLHACNVPGNNFFIFSSLHINYFIYSLENICITALCGILALCIIH